MRSMVRLKHINTLLLVAIIGVNLYVIASPFLPELRFWLEGRRGTSQSLMQIVTKPTPAQTSSSKPTDPNAGTNHLVIPVMHLNERVHEGSSKYVLSKGPWRRPNTSSPDRGGNTVIAAHRFTYTNPRGVFYFLDKLKPGDPIALFWNDKHYVYIVTKSYVTTPDDVAVEANTADDRLTLYTCTPLWNPKQRLVVTAQLESVYE